jgi:hypothetical protein
MARYEVIVLGVQGLNKKIYTAGEKVTEGNFPAGVAEELVKSGHLKSLEKKSDKKQEEAMKNLETCTTAYAEAQKAFTEIESKLADEKDEKKLDELNIELTNAKDTLKAAEKALNKAKADIKKLQ